MKWIWKEQAGAVVGFGSVRGCAGLCFLRGMGARIDVKRHYAVRCSGEEDSLSPAGGGD